MFNTIYLSEFSTKSKTFMLKKLHLIVFIGFFSLLLKAQTITEFSTGYTSPEGIAVDSNNTVFVTELYTGNIYQLDANGTQTLFATTNSRAHDIVFDNNDLLYVAEPFYSKIMTVDAAGVATDYLSMPNASPYGLAIKDGLLYFVSENSGNVVKINADLSTSNYATGLFTPEGIAFDSNGNLFVADRNDRKLFKITPTGTVTTITSNIENIRGVAIAPNDDVYFTKYKTFPEEHKILKYDAVTGTISDFVTTLLEQPRSITIDNLGNMYVTNLGSGKVIKIYDDSLLPSSTPQIVNIPDANFKAELVNNTTINTNADTEIQITEAEAYNDLLYLVNKNISSLTGIEAFTQLKYLFCSDNALTTLDVSANTNLLNLSCNNNQLTALDISTNTNLISLSCSNNQITSLDASASLSLENLYCEDNVLSSLNVTGLTSLTNLSSFNNQLTSLDLSGLTSLTNLRTSNNQLTSLTLTGATNLIEIECQQNQIATLDVSGFSSLTKLRSEFNQLTNVTLSGTTSLENLSTFNNLLTTLDVSQNTNLMNLSCYDNQITTLDLSANTSLEYLSCHDNQLTSINVSTNTDLYFLHCYNNQLPILDVTALTSLTDLACRNNQLSNLNLSSNINLINLICSNNTFSSLDLSNNVNLTSLTCHVNDQLTTLDLRNGNNTILTSFNMHTVPNLTCIFVDDEDYSIANWTNPNPETTSFIETNAECSILSVDLFETNRFRIFPNPASTQLNIETDVSFSKLTIYNLQGKKLLESAHASVNIEGLSKGIYLIKVEGENNKIVTERFIKE